MRTLFDALRTLVYTIGFLLFWVWVALTVRRYDAALGVTLPAWIRLPGIILMVLGGTIAASCVGTFVLRGRGTPAPFDAPRQLVAVGPYRWVRNPMYVGAELALVGLALFECSVSILLMVVGVWLMAHLLVYFYEEPTLRRSFGSSYEEYCRQVSRWLPCPPH